MMRNKDLLIQLNQNIKQLDLVTIFLFQYSPSFFIDFKLLKTVWVSFKLNTRIQY